MHEVQTSLLGNHKHGPQCSVKHLHQKQSMTMMLHHRDMGHPCVKNVIKSCSFFNHPNPHPQINHPINFTFHFYFSCMVNPFSVSMLKTPNQYLHLLHHKLYPMKTPNLYTPFATTYLYPYASKVVPCLQFSYWSLYLLLK